MRTFLTVLKNDYLRTVPRLASGVVITLIMLASIFLAVYMTGVQQVKGRVAFITQSTMVQVPKSSKLLEVTAVKQKPPRSALYKQKYNAFISVEKNGSYKIETLRSADFKKLLILLMKYPNANIKSAETDRGVGVNIIGYLMMFLLMLAFSNLFCFADDKEQGQLRRIATAPASFSFYLAAHCVYCLSLLLPSYLLLIILKLCGWNIGFSLFAYAGLFLLLGFLGISFALLLNTLIKKPDNANMLGNSVTVLSSVLAGGFYSFTKNNNFLDHAIRLLPQKEIMDFAQALQNGKAATHIGDVLYILIFSLILFTVSCIILHNKYTARAGAPTSVGAIRE